MFFTLSCKTNKVSQNHGYKALELKHDIIKVNTSNKNDILSIIGPPSSKSDFNENKWFYIERRKTNQSLIKLGIKKIEKNNILIVEFDKMGILIKKEISLLIEGKLLILLYLILEPNDCSNKIIVLISFTLGKFSISTFLLDNNDAAKIGSEEFFDPEIFTVPLSFFAPITSSFSIFYIFGKVTPICLIYLPFLSEYDTSGFSLPLRKTN